MSPFNHHHLAAVPDGLHRIVTVSRVEQGVLVTVEGEGPPLLFTDAEAKSVASSLLVATFRDGKEGA